MIVAESGKVTNTAVRLKSQYDPKTLELLSKVLTHNYRGRSLSSILTLDIIKDLESDIVSMGKVAENIIPSFISTLENMLNVDLYIDGLENIFSIPEYNDINKAKVFMNMVSRKQELTKLLMNRNSGVIVTIGNENDDDIMKDCRLITATYLSLIHI